MQVLELFEKAEHKEILLAMSWINAGELVYLVSREHGRDSAKSMLADLNILPITLYEATEERILSAAWIKADYPISYADAFAVGLAKELKAKLVSGDPEFKSVEKVVSMLWLEK